MIKLSQRQYLLYLFTGTLPVKPLACVFLEHMADWGYTDSLLVTKFLLLTIR